MNYSFDDGGTPAYRNAIKRNSLIFLLLVIAVNAGYWGWRYFSNENYQDCLKAAAKAAHGVHRAYADLREICESREVDRLINLAPRPPHKAASKDSLLDDLIPPDKR